MYSSRSTPKNTENDEPNRLLHGQELREALGFKTAEAFRAAVRNQRIPFPLIKLKGRKGWFAQAKDVKNWINTIDNDFAKRAGADKSK